MGSVKHLLLIAVLPLLARCQKPKVLIEPALPAAFIGDSVNLKCVTSATSVIWHKPNGERIPGAATLTVKIENSKDGGLYQCEANGMKSDSLTVNVKESDLSASLTIQTGSEKMQRGGAVILELENQNGLQGWRCWVYRGGKNTTMVALKLKNVSTWMVFQTADLIANETIYWCTDKFKTHRSNRVTLTIFPTDPPPEPTKGWLVIVLVGILLVLGVVILLVVLRRRRRSEGGRIYEDVALRPKERGDDKYETLQKASGREREYDTLAGASGSGSKGGEYEALKKEGMKEGVYHTLGVEGAAGGGGGYEALKKQGMKEGVYHTLGAEGAAGGGGGYEALKKEGMKEGVYHTLGVESAAGGESGYEA